MSETHGNPGDPPPEPKTPMWLPALGAVLFLTVGLVWGLMPSSKDASPASPSGSASAAPGGDAGAPVRH